MARIRVPTPISEAPTDRLRVGFDMDGTKRMLIGARAPTIGQGAAQGGAVRSPSAYLLSEQDDDDQQTTIQIVHRALVGTQLFKWLEEKKRAKGSISLDFRTFGRILHRFKDSDGDYAGFTVGPRATDGGAKGLSEISVRTATSGYYLADLFVAGTDGLDKRFDKEKIKEGGILEVITDTSKDDGPTIRTGGLVSSGFVKQDHNPEFMVISAILYDANGENPKAFVEAGASATFPWPNDGNGNVTSAGVDTDKHLVAHREQSVRWTAAGTVQDHQPGFGEDSALYTLSVTLTSAMGEAVLIHSSEADEFNPHYT